MRMVYMYTIYNNYTTAIPQPLYTCQFLPNFDTTIVGRSILKNEQTLYIATEISQKR